MRNKQALGWFLFGLGSQLQVVSSLSMTEIFVLLVTPFIAAKEIYYIRKNGAQTFLLLSFLLLAGCAVACVLNHVGFSRAIRGFAVCGLMPCVIIVSHWMLRKDMKGFRWMLVGGALSGVICTFVFQKASETYAFTGGQGAASAEDVMSGATYWTHRLSSFITLPAKGWYLNCPLVYSVCAPVFVAAFSLLTTVSGRGMTVKALATAAMVIIGGKKMSTIHSRVCRRFVLIVLIGIVGGLGVKTLYQTSASNGWLGEKALAKYEAQTKGKTGVMALLLGGRMSSFCGLIACIDKPLVGFGPWAPDMVGYRTEFLSKYGDDEDLDQHLKSERFRVARGMKAALIPCHSVITEMWLWYGISGLIFVSYMIFVMVRFLRQDCWAVPQWYFWLAASIPATLWDFCFNPLSNRVGVPMFIVACLVARAVRRGAMQMPYEMLDEIARLK